ncbi:hypothetical protein SynSYN20_00838 [Synechococcus sp. SYN20]|nr:hypothetical protein SynSYN20_00838 [Synechococcus sp. SYN20]
MPGDNRAEPTNISHSFTGENKCLLKTKMVTILSSLVSQATKQFHSQVLWLGI